MHTYQVYWDGKGLAAKVISGLEAKRLKKKNGIGPVFIDNRLGLCVLTHANNRIQAISNIDENKLKPQVKDNIDYRLVPAHMLPFKEFAKRKEGLALCQGVMLTLSRPVRPAAQDANNAIPRRRVRALACDA